MPGVALPQQRQSSVGQAIQLGQAAYSMYNGGGKSGGGASDGVAMQGQPPPAVPTDKGQNDMDSQYRQDAINRRIMMSQGGRGY